MYYKKETFLILPVFSDIKILDEKSALIDDQVKRAVILVLYNYSAFI